MRRQSCVLCDTERGTVVGAYLAAGRSPNWIEGQMRAMNTPTMAKTIRAHRDICLAGQADNAALLAAVDNPHTPISDNPDFALAIRGEAQRLLAAGQLRVTAAHGLKAQELLDRRAERQADRQLMVELAMLLSGARGSGPPADLIEADWHEVGPVQIEASG